MKNAFTLMEVMVAVLIASISGLALLQMNSQAIYLFERMKETSRMTETASLIGLHADKRFHKTDKTLYDLLDGSYEIINDEFRKYLKETKYTYHETLIDTISLGEEELDEMDPMTDEEAQAQNSASIQFELIQISFKNSLSHGSVLIARPF